MLAESLPNPGLNIIPGSGKILTRYYCQGLSTMTVNTSFYIRNNMFCSFLCTQSHTLLPISPLADQVARKPFKLLVNSDQGSVR